MSENLQDLIGKIKISKKSSVIIILVLFLAGFALLFADRLPKNEQDTNNDDSFEDYAELLEEKIQNISLGMGLKCEVSVVLEGGGRKVYLDTKKVAAAGKEEGYVVIKNESGGEAGLLVTTQNPGICGVAAVLHGATENQCKQFKESVAALLNIRMAKINVIIA